MASTSSSGKSKKSAYPSPASPPSSAILNAIKVLSLVRIATGAACIIAPRFTCAQHEYELPVEHAFAIRMMGIREGVNGGLLITAGDREHSAAGRREIRRAIWAGMIADAADVLSLTYGLVKGEVGKTTALIIGGAAVGAITLARFILSGL